MKTRILLMTTMIASVMFSCDMKKNEIAKRVADSLRNELAVNNKMTEDLVEIGVLLDSIDASRHALRTNMIEGTNYQNYVARMRDLNQYAKKSERKIKALERKSRKSSNTAYVRVIKKLRADLELRNRELAVLNARVDFYKKENEDLVKTVNLQRAEIDEKLAQIKTKQEETAQLEAQVNQLLTQSKLDQGEAYFARAVAVEETSKRTKFAPKKRKNSQKEALELYRLALAYGKQEAEARITKLEKRKL